MSEPHDPPLVGAGAGSRPRIESYNKDFKPMPLGTIRLEKGRGPLTLRAVKIPGRQALEVSALVIAADNEVGNTTRRRCLRPRATLPRLDQA